jgi:hypothetical protein
MIVGDDILLHLFPFQWPSIHQKREDKKTQAFLENVAQLFRYSLGASQKALKEKSQWGEVIPLMGSPLPLLCIVVC